MDGSLYYVHSDLLGSTVAVSDAAGQPLSRSHYLPYGEVYKSEYWDGNQWQEYHPATTPLPETDYLYTGHLLDRNTNLYYYGGGRYYDPALAHFTSPSQYTDAPFNPQNLNRYGFRLGNPLRYAQIGERYLFDRGAGTTVADVLPPDTFTAGFGRVVSVPPSTLTGVDLEEMVTSVPLGLHVRILKTLKKLPAFRSAYRMARGGFNIVWAGEYVPGSSRVLVYGTHAIRQELDIPLTLSHGGARAWAKYPGLGRWTMGFWGTTMTALRAARWWIIGPAVLVNAYVYSPWGPKGDIGYGTECLAAVTVDIALATGSTLAGALVYAGILALGFPPSWALVGGTLAFLGTLWLGPKVREPLIEVVNEVYKGLAGGLNRGQGDMLTRWRRT